MKFLTLEQFTEMWKLQDELNTVTSGPNWKELNQNWNLAIKSEVMEFFDYIGWKWWKEPDAKKKPSDMQARLELVDIWHFLLSRSIEACEETGCDLNTAYTQIIEFDLELEPKVELLSRVDHGNLMLVERVNYLTAVIEACEWTWDELYKAYIGKVALNNFRQANGYKEGTYQKIWCKGRMPGEEYEDNFYLEQILHKLQEDQNLSYFSVYTNLEHSYTTRPSRY